MTIHTRPKKSLGQHFIHDQNLLRRIAHEMDILPGDRILEIGAGQGALTERLLESSAEKVLSIEIDRRWAALLEAKFGRDERFRVHQGDFLKVNIAEIMPGDKPVRIVGNLPYFLTSPILFHLWDQRSLIQDALVMVQKEVGERLASPPGNKNYGIPSVLFQLVADLNIVMHVPPQVFIPQPKVDSAVIQIDFLEALKFPVQDVDLFRKLVRTGFNQRRKMLRNTLKSFFAEIEFNDKIVYLLDKRPEHLSVEEWAMLSNTVSHQH